MPETDSLPPDEKTTDEEFAAALSRLTDDQLYHFVWMLRDRGLLPIKKETTQRPSTTRQSAT